MLLDVNVQNINTNIASQILSKIISTYIINKEFGKNYLLKIDDYKISFYDKNRIFNNKWFRY